MDWKIRQQKEYFCFADDIKRKEKEIKYMTKKYIKNFSAEYKTTVVLELLESELTISQLSKKY